MEKSGGVFGEEGECGDDDVELLYPMYTHVQSASTDVSSNDLLVTVANQSDRGASLSTLSTVNAHYSELLDLPDMPGKYDYKQTDGISNSRDSSQTFIM